MFWSKKAKEKKETDKVKHSISNGIPRLQDLFAPDGIDFSRNDEAEIGNKFSRSFAVIGYPANVSVGWLDELLSYNGELDTAIHIWPTDDREAIEQLTTQITKLEAQLYIEDEKGSNRHVTRLRNAIADLYRQRERLELRLERMYYISILANLYSNELESLDKETVRLENRVKSQSIQLRTMKFRQRDCFRSVLPFSNNYMEDLYRNFDSGALTATFPFYNSNISHPGGILMGVNLETNAPVHVNFYDRDILKNGNCNIFAPSGAGKTVQLEVTTMRSVLHGIRHVFIDPEGDYTGLVKYLNGVVIPIKTNSPFKLNPCDLEEEVDEYGKIFVNIDEKVADVLNLIGVMVGGLQPDIRALVASVIKECYLSREFNSDPKSLYKDDTALDGQGNYKHRSIKKDMPTLGEIQVNLEARVQEFSSKMDVTDLMKVTIALKAFTNGQIYDLFDGQTSPELQNFKDNPIISFDVSSLEESVLRPVGLFAALSWSWEKFLKKNPHLKKRVVVDEAWMFLSPNMAGHEFTGNFLETVSRRARKRNSALFCASQSYAEFAENSHGRAVLSNAETTILLQQSSTNILEVQDLFKLSDGERDFISTCQVGEGIIKTRKESAAFHNYLFPNEKEIIDKCNPSLNKKGA